MKQLLDFLPLLVFFLVYKLEGIYAATGALILATAVQIGAMYILYRKVEKMHLVTFALVAVFGTATLLLKDDAFIKWKVTVVYALFALAVLISQWINKPVLKAMLGKELTLPDPVWRNISYGWAGFFSFCAALNVYVAFNLPQETWVNFKVFGLMGMTFAFILATGVYLYKYLPKDSESE